MAWTAAFAANDRCRDLRAPRSCKTAGSGAKFGQFKTGSHRIEIANNGYVELCEIGAPG
jgi:hypothetical protein